MPRDTSSDFIASKNAATNTPIYLYRVSVDGVDANDMFLCDQTETVSFFKDTDTAQDYLPFPITHSNISSNTAGQVDSPVVTIANVSREIQAYLELYDGLRGRKVTIRQVFRDHLDEAAARIEDIYWVDSVTATAETVQFRLVSRLDLVQVTLPGRRFSRNYCPWTYKGRGCWIEDDTVSGGYRVPTAFSTQDTQILDATIEGAGDVDVTIWEDYISDTAHPKDRYNKVKDAQAQVYLGEVSVPGLSAQTGALNIDLRFGGDLNSSGFLQISSGGDDTATSLYLHDLTLLGFTETYPTWQTFHIPLADFGYENSGDAIADKVNFVRWYQPGNTTVGIAWQNLTITQPTPFPVVAEARLHAIDLSGLDPTADLLFIDMKASVPGSLSSDGYLQISSGDESDDESLFREDLTGLGVTTDWQTFEIALSNFDYRNSGDAIEDTGIVYIRWYEKSSVALTLSFRNASVRRLTPHSIDWPDGLDTCLKTMADCVRHNNVSRYGGFPTVPSRMVTRA